MLNTLCACVCAAGFYTEKLAFLVPLGLITGVCQIMDGDDTIATPLYAIVTALWGTLFIEFWKRQEASLRSQWNVENFETEEELRPEFMERAEEELNEHTGKIHLVYSPWKRYLSLMFSVTVLLVLALVVVVSTMCLMLIKVILAEKAGMAGQVVVGMANFAMIEIMNRAYFWIAIKMTDWENHPTQTTYEDHLIAKCFIFQFFNSYSSFFYIAFLEGHVRVFGKQDQCPMDDCMMTLRIQLATIFVMHLLLQQTLEVFWPIFSDQIARIQYVFCTQGKICCTNLWRRFKAFFCYVPLNYEEEEEMYRNLTSSVYTDEELDGFRPSYAGVLLEYNELVLQYGFVTLFAPAFPAAALIAMINNVVEIKADGYKLCKFHRRPEYSAAQDIGSWQYIIEVISVLSIITNCAIIAFTSHALARMELVQTQDRLSQVLVAFFCEHVILAIKLFIHVVVEDDPEHVLIRRQKREYEARKASIIAEALETEDEKFQFRKRYVEAPDEYEQHVDLQDL